MRLLVMADIHADPTALERVLKAATREGFDEVALLGDLIGYGSQPRRTLELLAGLPLRASVLGNHEFMLQELQHGRLWPLPDAVVRPLELCLEQLDAEAVRELTSLPDTALEAQWQAVHGRPGARFEYLVSGVDARRAEPHLQADLCLFGHTHLPGVFSQAQGRWRFRPARLEKQEFSLPEGERLLLNPGSVARNRDQQGGSSFGILDLNTRTFAVHRFD